MSQRLTLVPQPDAAVDTAADARIAVLEHRLDEQEQALRRVLTLLVDWLESPQGRTIGGMSSGYTASTK